ncbi:hypothetical protein PYCC9005_000783 [Savitreella phatthalungensis]
MPNAFQTLRRRASSLRFKSKETAVSHGRPTPDHASQASRAEAVISQPSSGPVYDTPQSDKVSTSTVPPPETPPSELDTRAKLDSHVEEGLVGFAFSSPAEERDFSAMQFDRVTPQDEKRPSSPATAGMIDHADDDADLIDMYYNGDSLQHSDDGAHPEADASRTPSVGSGLKTAYPIGSTIQASASASTQTASPRPSLDRRDRYGFRCTTTWVDQGAYDEWSLSYEAHLRRRKKKWDTLLKEHGLLPTEPGTLPQTFPESSPKVQRYVRKGIPPEYRGQAWWHYANGQQRLHRYPGHYQALVKEAGEVMISGAEGAADLELIERDLHRTFPDNLGFRTDLTDSRCEKPDLIPSLRRVLQASALHRPGVGYCQSLNFIAAMLLLFLDEERAFWLLQIMCERHLPGSHDRNLEGANVDQAIFLLVIRETLPTAVWQRMRAGANSMSSARGPAHGLDAFAQAAANAQSQVKRNNSSSSTSFWRRSAHHRSPGTTDPFDKEREVTNLPPVTLVTSAWFMSAFVGQLPTETCLRVWDLLWYEGSRTLFRVALTLIRLGEKSLLRLARPSGLERSRPANGRSHLGHSERNDDSSKRGHGAGSTGSRTTSAAGSVRSITSSHFVGRKKSDAMGDDVEPMDVFQLVQALPKRQLDANSFIEQCFGSPLRMAVVASPPYSEGLDPFRMPAASGSAHNRKIGQQKHSTAAGGSIKAAVVKLTQHELDRSRIDVRRIRAYAAMLQEESAAIDSVDDSQKHAEDVACSSTSQASATGKVRGKRDSLHKRGASVKLPQQTKSAGSLASRTVQPRGDGESRITPSNLVDTVRQAALQNARIARAGYKSSSDAATASSAGRSETVTTERGKSLVAGPHGVTSASDTTTPPTSMPITGLRPASSGMARSALMRDRRVSRDDLALLNH